MCGGGGGGGGETSINNLGKMEIYKLYPVWSISENGSNYPVSTAIYHSLATETGIHWLQRQAFTGYRDRHSFATETGIH